MAHFIGRLQGSRGSASRLGTKNSGVSASAQGWEIGARVTLSHSSVADNDIVTVFLTHGSNARGHAQCIGQFIKRDGEFVKVGEWDDEPKMEEPSNDNA